jgi:ankyrin repeat protein
MSAAEHGAFQGVSLLLKNGAEPDARSNSRLHYKGWTALMFAAAKGNPRSAQALLRGGADPELENSKGETALALAIANEHPQTAEVIRRHLNQAEQAGTGQPATRPVFESEGSDKPQPEAEGRSR